MDVYGCGIGRKKTTRIATGGSGGMDGRGSY
jgi:hypothetical protein